MTILLNLKWLALLNISQWWIIVSSSFILWRSEVAQSYLTLCNPIDCIAHQASILEWVATSFSRGSSQPRDWTCIPCIGKQILHYCAVGENPNHHWVIPKASETKGTIRGSLRNTSLGKSKVSEWGLLMVQLRNLQQIFTLRREIHSNQELFWAKWAWEKTRDAPDIADVRKWEQNKPWIMNVSPRKTNAVIPTFGSQETREIQDYGKAL